MISLLAIDAISLVITGIYTRNWLSKVVIQHIATIIIIAYVLLDGETPFAIAGTILCSALSVYNAYKAVKDERTKNQSK